jgi:hypothetical protein
MNISGDINAERAPGGPQGTLTPRPRRWTAARLLRVGCYLGLAVSLALLCFGVILLLGGAETPEEQATGWATFEGIVCAVVGILVGGSAVIVLLLSRTSPLAAGVLTLASGVPGIAVALLELSSQGFGFVPSVFWPMMSWGVVVSALGAAAITEDRLRAPSVQA